MFLYMCHTILAAAGPNEIHTHTSTVVYYLCFCGGATFMLHACVHVRCMHERDANQPRASAMTIARDCK